MSTKVIATHRSPHPNTTQPTTCTTNNTSKPQPTRCTTTTPVTYHLLLFHRTQRQPSQRFHDRLRRQDHRFFIFPFASFLFRRSCCFRRGFLLRFFLFFWWIVLFLFWFLHFFCSSGSFLFGLTPCGTKKQTTKNQSECHQQIGMSIKINVQIDELWKQSEYLFIPNVNPNVNQIFNSKIFISKNVNPNINPNVNPNIHPNIHQNIHQNFNSRISIRHVNRMSIECQ